MSSFSRIVVATDGSADAGLAARAAIDLASHAPAILDVVSAWGVTAWPYVYGTALDELIASSEAESRRLVDAVAAQAAAAGVRIGELRVLRTPAAAAVIAAAEELGDDLIVVGSRGLGPVRRLLMGSVSDAIVHQAGRPVLVARGGDDAWPPRVVVGADDGDDATLPALRMAAGLAHLIGARLELIEVVPQAVRLSSMSEHEALAAVRARLDARAGLLAGETGTRPGTEVRVGDVAGELLDAAPHHERCLIVAGSHGKSALQRLRLGSSSTNLVHAAECPVLVVPCA